MLVADNTSVETNDAKLTHSAAFTFICATRSLLKMMGEPGAKKLALKDQFWGNFVFTL